jgi:4-diphosphocytidyl-2-C-methyl-D-erythritol kinase
MNGVHRALAPAKVNLGLFLGPSRESDSRHELVSVMQSISLADELTLERAPLDVADDEVLCPGVPGPQQQNLAAQALVAFREASGWEAPPLRLSVRKRIPVAAGLGGGSADAAATLRLLRHASGLGDEQLLLELAGELGADVPAQVTPGRWLASGAGERLEVLPDPRAGLGLLLLPAADGLATAAVYGEADRLGLARTAGALEELKGALRAALARGAPLPSATELLHNDLQRAAVSLRSEIANTLREVRGAGADIELLSGSGPTVIGLFAGAGRSPESGFALARLAAEQFAERVPVALSATTVGADFGHPFVLDPAAVQST